MQVTHSGNGCLCAAAEAAQGIQLHKTQELKLADAAEDKLHHNAQARVFSRGVFHPVRSERKLMARWWTVAEVRTSLAWLSTFNVPEQK